MIASVREGRLCSRLSIRYIRPCAPKAARLPTTTFGAAVPDDAKARELLSPVFRLGTVALVAACWLSAGGTPFVDAIAGAANPGDWARDYVTARARLKEGRGPPPLAEDGNRHAIRYGAPLVLLLGRLTPITHPPPRWWSCRSHASPGALARWPGRGRPPSRSGGWQFHCLEFSAPGAAPLPGPRCVSDGGAGALAPDAALFRKRAVVDSAGGAATAGFRSLEARQTRRAGAYFGAAAVLNITPIVLLGALILRSRRAASGQCWQPRSGWCWFRSQWSAERPGARSSRALPATKPPGHHGPLTPRSLDGVYARLLTSNPFSQPILRSRPGSRAQPLSPRRYPPRLPRSGQPTGGVTPPQSRQACLLAAGLTLPVPPDPLWWSHVVLMLLGPRAILVRDAGPRTRAAATLMLAALTVPRQRLMGMGRDGSGRPGGQCAPWTTRVRGLGVVRQSARQRTAVSPTFQRSGR